MRRSFRVLCWFAIVVVHLALASGRVDIYGQQVVKDGPQQGFVPSISLTTANGERVDLRQLTGDKVGVFHLLYTRCVACGNGMEHLKAVQNELARDGLLGEKVVIFSITVDPERDTPEALKTYAKSIEVKPGWTFLTGTAAQIQKVRANFEPPPLDLSASEKEATRTLKHTGMLQIINGATGKRTSISVTAEPEHILDRIARVQSPEP